MSEVLAYYNKRGERVSTGYRIQKVFTKGIKNLNWCFFKINFFEDWIDKFLFQIEGEDLCFFRINFYEVLL